VGGETGGSQQILFDSEGEGRSGEKHDHAIFAVDVDGSDVTRISPEGISATEPAWSPNRTRIAYQSDYADPGNTDIYVMDADGTASMRLTTNPMIDSSPAWAPDGERIVFERADAKGYLDIFVLNLGTGVETRLTDAEAITGQPSWSPDGRFVAFARNVGNDANIYTIDVESHAEIQITSGEAFDTHPVWSPDGSTIAFDRRMADSPSSDIWIMAADGSNARALVTTPANETAPMWSPDGSEILFISTTVVAASNTAHDVIPRAEIIPADPGAASLPLPVAGVVPLFSVSW
jgi:Tol biopolymer transport system component